MRLIIYHGLAIRCNAFLYTSSYMGKIFSIENSSSNKLPSLYDLTNLFICIMECASSNLSNPFTHWYTSPLVNTGVKHSLASSEYNTRRKECEEGIRFIQEKYPKIISLREATMQILNECVSPTNHAVVYNRCKYVIEEIEMQ